MVSDRGVPDEVALRVVWKAASDALAVSDRDGMVLAANPAYCELYGYAANEVLGQTFAVIFPESERAHAATNYRAVFDGPANQPPFQSVVLRRDGSQRTVESRIAFVEEHGRRVAMVSVVRDVTVELRARRAAEDAEHSRQDFLSSLSHDIKSPLAIIKGQAQLMRRHVIRSGPASSPDRLIAGLSQVEASALQVSGLVDEMVEVAGLPDGGVPPLNLARADLVALARTAVERYQRLTDEHSLTLQVATDSVPGYWDTVRVQRLLDNLIGNAIKYSPEGGPVTVRVAQAVTDSDAPGVTLTVADHGIGISSADLPHVFERFRRGTNVDGIVAGSGIGLSSVREIVRQHGGAVEITSEEGQGTEVLVWLPLQPPIATAGGSA